MTGQPGDSTQMQLRTPARRRWWRRILLPAAPDVLALLVAQGEHSASGLDAFNSWSHGGGPEAAAALRTARHAAHAARRELLETLQAALSTPVDQEHLYILSERIDRVLNEARNALREAEILGWTPDSHAGMMGDRLAEGTQALVAGFGLLTKDPEAAGRQSDAASEAVRHVERDYREAVVDLRKVNDLRAVMTAQDVYRRYLRVAEAIVAVADRLWYIVLRGA
jgi:uncharacterized protein Yka (UPF0111/DUF47 family)